MKQAIRSLHSLLTLTLTLTLLSSCREKEVTVPCYQLKPEDFIEKITVPGTFRALKTATITSPQTNEPSYNVKFLAEDGLMVKKDDVVCILDAPALSTTLESIEVMIETRKAELTKLEADNALTLANLQTSVDNAMSRVALNSLDSFQQLFAPPLQKKLFDLELQKARIELEKARKKYKAQKSIDDSEVRSMKSRIMRDESLVQRFRDQLSSLTIKAPFDGMVVHVTAPMLSTTMNGSAGTFGGKIEVNSSVWNEMPLLQMPDVSAFELVLSVPEIEYQRIAIGQKADISINYNNQLKTTGSIKKKSMAGKAVQRNSTIKYYEVLVSVDSLNHLLKPGLGAECEIKIHEVPDTVVVPAIAIFTVDSSKVVYVRNENMFEPVKVTTGESNTSVSVITSGLDGNETIALTEPPYQLILNEDKRRNKEKPGLTKLSNSR